jgi:hypothetical protein
MRYLRSWGKPQLLSQIKPGQATKGGTTLVANLAPGGPSTDGGGNGLFDGIGCEGTSTGTIGVTDLAAAACAQASVRAGPGDDDGAPVLD